ncbi:MAG: Glu/Leu/Phe/Val dehydrogenase [Candidatus Zixiibacteriota bacterium]|nr:MAG: Glu/Leu/Phe/Val dehydrogenase [candidate division Zixibacteria bacterium]
MSEPSLFNMAQRQLDLAARKLGLDETTHALLREPLREFRFQLPVRMDDGTTRLFKGYHVQYNDARGPAWGGVRFHPSETLDTLRALAAWITWKAAVMDLPLGGSKGGVVCNPKGLSVAETERLARAYLRTLVHHLGLTRDILAPDVFTGPQTMAWMLDEFESIAGEKHPGAVTGKPLPLGGSRGRDEAIARGAVAALREACKVIPIARPDALSYAIQGFGVAGEHAALLHPEILGGGLLTAVSDSGGGIYNPRGIDPRRLVQYKIQHGRVAGFPESEPISQTDLLELPVDVLYPAALEQVISEENAPRIRTRVVCELANGPTTPEADEILRRNGVFIIPDCLANAGGMIVSYFEQVQNACNYYWTVDDVNRQLEARIVQAFADVCGMQRRYDVTMRVAATMAAVAKVAEAMKLRGWV